MSDPYFLSALPVRTYCRHTTACLLISIILTFLPTYLLPDLSTQTLVTAGWNKERTYSLRVYSKWYAQIVVFIKIYLIGLGILFSLIERRRCYYVHRYETISLSCTRSSKTKKREYRNWNWDADIGIPKSVLTLSISSFQKDLKLLTVALDSAPDKKNQVRQTCCWRNVCTMSSAERGKDSYQSKHRQQTLGVINIALCINSGNTKKSKASIIISVLFG